jgi:hypothetical protein
MWPQLVARYPTLGEFYEKTTRRFPIIISRWTRRIPARTVLIRDHHVTDDGRVAGSSGKGTLADNVPVI